MFVGEVELMSSGRQIEREIFVNMQLAGLLRFVAQVKPEVRQLSRFLTFYKNRRLYFRGGFRRNVRNLRGRNRACDQEQEKSGDHVSVRVNFLVESSCPKSLAG